MAAVLQECPFCENEGSLFPGTDPGDDLWVPCPCGCYRGLVMRGDHPDYIEEGLTALDEFYMDVRQEKAP